MKNSRSINRIQEPRNGIQFIVKPQDRELLKPFVFFDAGNMTRTDEGLEIHAHPHSGIGIITYFEGTDLHHGDSGDNDGIIKSGGIQWIRAGGGVWHQESYHRNETQPSGPRQASIHQLWMQLPPELEEAEVAYANIQPDQVPRVENVKVIVGTYKGVAGRIKTPFQMTYLDIELEEGAKWDFSPPAGQTKGFLFPRSGSVVVNEVEVPNQKMGILEQGEGQIQIKALTAVVKCVLVLAEPSPHPVVISRSSIHTNEAALSRSMERIKNIGQMIY